MNVSAAVDRHFDFLMDLQEQDQALIEARADEIYADLWGQCKDGVKAHDIVEKHGDIPTETLAEILQKAAQLSRAGVMSMEAKTMLASFVMAKLTTILSDAADFTAECK